MAIAHLRALQRRPRVVYARNPLVEVIAAIRFPSVLALTEEPPSALQRELVRDYPLVEVRQPVGALSISGGGDPQALSSGSLGTTFLFSSADNKWTVSVEPTLLAITCRAYEQWAAFWPRFSAVTELMIRLYGIGLVTRLGLRYVDVIDKEALGLAGSSWSDLVAAPVLGTPLFFTEGLDECPPMQFVTTLAIPPGSVNIKISTVENRVSKTKGMLIDTDCFCEGNLPTDVSELGRKANELHEYTSIVFQACITDRLHDALQSR